jgi:hypothetical protein
MICGMVTLPLGAVLVLHACPLSLRYQKEAVHFTKTLHRQRRRRGLGIAAIRSYRRHRIGLEAAVR